MRVHHFSRMMTWSLRVLGVAAVVFVVLLILPDPLRPANAIRRWRQYFAASRVIGDLLSAKEGDILILADDQGEELLVGRDRYASASEFVTSYLARARTGRLDGGKAQAPWPRLPPRIMPQPLPTTGYVRVRYHGRILLLHEVGNQVIYVSDSSSFEPLAVWIVDEQ
jgi:hypothetical protein